MKNSMTDPWYGAQVVITGEVVLNVPLPLYEQIALEMYANALRVIKAVKDD